MDLAPGTEVDRYTVEALLGAGGMGTVYRVRHRDLGSLHALKILHHASPALRDRLVQEGRLQGSLQHPGVLRVTDLIQVEGRPALVLEYVEGQTLADVVTAGPVPAAELDDWVQRLLEGVAAAHRHGLIHRDLKPENVLLARVDGQVQPKVADFGLARALDSDGPRLTVSQMPMGTPAYMAPEQFQDASRVDARADVFSLGAMLYEMVTGRMAFSGGSLPEIMGRASRGEYAPVLDLAPATPAAWVAAIDGALAPERDDRLSSVEALLAIWTGRAVSDPLDVPAHPDLQALLSAPDTPSHAAHLADCAACRVELRLYRQAFRGETLAPAERRWPRRVLGAVLGLLLTLVVLAAALGGLGSLGLLGPWAPAYGLLGAVGGAMLAAGAEDLRVGRVGGLVRWLAVPSAIVAVGALGCGSGAAVALRAIEAASVEQVPIFVAAASNVTLSAWWAAQLLSVPALLAVLAVVVWARRTRAATPRFEPWPAGLAIAGGGLMWLAESLVAADRTATLLVYGTVVAAGLLASLLPDETPADAFGRLLGACAAVLAGASAALAVQVEDLRSLHEAATEVRWDDPTVPVEAAAAFAHAWSAAFNPWTLAWIFLSACVGLVVFAQTRPDHRASVPAISLLARYGLFAALVLVPAGAWNTRTVQRLTDQMVPAWQAAAVATWVPALHLESTVGALVVNAGAAVPFAAGDRVVALGDRAVSSVGDLVDLLQECACPSVCSAVPACLEAQVEVPVTVEREGRLLPLVTGWRP